MAGLVVHGRALGPISRVDVEAIADCSLLAFWTLSRGLDRGVLGYDPAGRVGRVPRDDEVHEPREVGVRATARRDRVRPWTGPKSVFAWLSSRRGTGVRGEVDGCVSWGDENGKGAVMAGSGSGEAGMLCVARVRVGVECEYGESDLRRRELAGDVIHELPSRTTSISSAVRETCGISTVPPGDLDSLLAVT